MIGRVVVSASDDKFLDMKTFVIQIFEHNDTILLKSLKSSLLRESSIEGRLIKLSIPPSCTSSWNSRGKALMKKLIIRKTNLLC